MERRLEQFYCYCWLTLPNQPIQATGKGRGGADAARLSGPRLIFFVSFVTRSLRRADTLRKTMEQTKKKHHYLPRFYLEGFADQESDRLWVYEKGIPEMRPSSPAKEGCQKFYHAFLTDDGNKDTNTIENYLQQIEATTGCLLVSIHNRDRFTDDNKRELALFISFMLTRVPLFRNEIEKMAAIHINHVGLDSAITNFEAAISTFRETLGIEPSFSQEDLLDLASSRGSILSLTHMFLIAFNFIPNLLDLKWRFLFSNCDIGYVTSDNPIYFYSQNSQGIGHDDLLNDDIEITVPLSKKVALLAKRRDIQPGYGDARNQSIKSINKRTIISAKDRVYSDVSSDTLNNLVQKYQNNRPYMVLTN